MRAQPATELRRKGAAVCLLAAPLLMLTGDVLRIWAGAAQESRAGADLGTEAAAG